MYEERPPGPGLADRVACGWHRSSEVAFTQLVVPDACVDLVWGASGLFVAGPDTGPMPATIGAGETMAGVRFKPGAVGDFLGVPLQELRDQRVSLADLPGGEALVSELTDHPLPSPALAAEALAAAWLEEPGVAAGSGLAGESRAAAGLRHAAELEAASDRRPALDPSAPADPRLAADLHLATDRRLAADLRLAAEARLAAELRLAGDRRPAAGQRGAVERSLAAERRPDVERSLAVERRLAVERSLTAERRPSAEPSPAVERRLAAERQAAGARLAAEPSVGGAGDPSVGASVAPRVAEAEARLRALLAAVRRRLVTSPATSPATSSATGLATGLVTGSVARFASPVDPVAPAIAAALSKGRTVAEVAWDLGFSERQLQRRSVMSFGYAPKTLQRIVRFQHALRLARAGVPLAEVAVMAGYTDQAHLANDVKRLSGVSMSRLVSPVRQPA
ncbi:DUF6597 domain-containing transcriptional factor [Nonomuraea sp. MTCD27]|uniref:DUF6597 domain-containing transcriptional factor n=1 Tax=Nonomuraea sp. MTCD27 TaxID=1676747 RepID=UPI0035BF0729